MQKTLLLILIPLFSTIFFIPHSLTAQTSQPGGCSIDLILALDGSGSIAPDDFVLMREFVRNLVNAFEIGPTDANIGIIQFSETAELYLPLSQDKEEILAAIDNMTQFGNRTDIAGAIQVAEEQFAVRRQGIPRVILILTDGLHNMAGNPIAQADIARAHGTKLFGISVGTFDLSELIAISGGDANVITVGGFESLNLILDILLNNTCAVISQPGVTAEPAVIAGTPAASVSAPLPPQGQRETQMVFSSNRDGDFDIYTMNADGTNLLQLTTNDATDNKPAWSKDGQRIAFESDLDGDFDIYMMNSDGSGLQILTDNTVNDWGPAWSPDGTRLAFHSNRSGNTEIYVMNVDGSNVQQVTHNAAISQSATWSPDGQQLIYYSDKSGGREIYTIDLNTQQEWRLTENEFYDGNADWSLNGTQIVFGSARNDNNAEIWIMRVDGTNPLRLTSRSGVDDDPVWSPDSQHIAFESDTTGNFEIWVMNPDGTGLQQLTDDPATDWSVDWMWKP